MQNILSAILFLIAAFLIVFSLYAVTYRSMSKISRTFAVFMLLLAVYAGGYGGELLSKTIDRMIFWNTFQYIGISFIPFLWISLATKYVNIPFSKTRTVRLLLFVFSCITLFGAFTDPLLHLKYSTIYISREPGFPVLGFTAGPLYHFHVLYLLGALLTVIVLLSHSLLSTGKTFRKTLILMIIGSSLPGIDYVLYLINIRFPGIDTIPFSMFFSVLCIALAVFSENFLDAIPVARSLVFQTLSDPVIVIDAQQRVADFNNTAEILFPGISPDKNPIPDLLKSVNTTDATEFQTDIPFNGKKHKFNCHITTIPTADRHEITGKILLFKDITESTRLFEKMEELATVDSLTNLYNRRHFMDQAENIISKLKQTNGTVSFIIADLDLFKKINDTRGHLAGDAAIHAAASVFRSYIQPPNITARFGGEEFVCLLPETDINEAFAVAEQIRKKIERLQYRYEGQKNGRQSDAQPEAVKYPYITASFGVSSMPAIAGEQTITMLVARADKALYQSKNKGRNRTTIG